MKKLICPVCGANDFIKYDFCYTWQCLSCGMEYTEDDVLAFEKEVPDFFGSNYGATIINTYSGGYNDFGIHKSDGYYDDFIENYDQYYQKYAEDASISDKDEKRNGDSYG